MKGFVKLEQQKGGIVADTSLWRYWTQPEWRQWWWLRRRRQWYCPTASVCTRTGAERYWKFAWRCSQCRSKRPQADQPPNPPRRPGHQNKTWQTWILTDFKLNKKSAYGGVGPGEEHPQTKQSKNRTADYSKDFQSHLRISLIGYTGAFFWDLVEWNSVFTSRTDSPIRWVR